MRPHTPSPASTVDQDAVRKAIRRARRLYTAAYDAEAVAEVTAELRDYIAVLVPVCQEIRAGLPPDTPGRARITTSLACAGRLLTGGPGAGEMAALVHMQLLADSADILAHHVRSAPRRPAAGRLPLGER